MQALLSPSGSTDALKSPEGYQSPEESILFNLLPTAINVILPVSITGLISEFPEVSTVSISKDFLPPFSFVSLIPEATKYGVSNSWLSFKLTSIESDSEVVKNEVCVPYGLVPDIGLICEVIFVPGNSIVLIEAIPTS